MQNLENSRNISPQVISQIKTSPRRDASNNKDYPEKPPWNDRIENENKLFGTHKQNGQKLKKYIEIVTTIN